MEIRCRDVAVECDYVARADDEDDLLRRLADHARVVHGFREITPELGRRIRDAMHPAAAPPTP